MAVSANKRINVTFPTSLLEELRRHVPARERNRFIVEATQKEIKLARLAAVLEDLRLSPAWSEEDHPDLMTVEDIDHYVRQLRKAWMPHSWDEIVAEEEKQRA